MNPTIKILAFLIGGLAITVGSYVTIAALTGTQVADIPGMSAFVDPLETEVRATVTTPLNQQLADDRRGTRQVMNAAANPLRAFVMESPFDADQLNGLANQLKSRLEEMTQREEELNTRSKRLDASLDQLERVRAEIDSLRTNLIDERSTLELRADELVADQAALEARRLAEIKMFAPLYETGRPSEAAKRLLANKTPALVTQILAELDPNRVRELLLVIRHLDAGAYEAIETARRDG